MARAYGVLELEVKSVASHIARETSEIWGTLWLVVGMIRKGHDVAFL
jgi:hypothetical protein